MSAVTTTTANSTVLLSSPSIIFATVGVVLALAGLLVIFRAAYARAQIEALRGDRDDLMKRTEILEHDNTRLTTELETAKAKIEVLEQLATGKSAVGEVREMLAAHDGRVARLETVIKRIDLHTTPGKGG